MHVPHPHDRERAVIGNLAQPRKPSNIRRIFGTELSGARRLAMS
jgi:hypothetical protein